MRKIAGDECLAHELAVGGDGGEVLEATGEAGEDLADILDGGCGGERRLVGSVFDPCLPETVFPQIKEGIIRCVIVVVPADKEKSGGETVA